MKSEERKVKDECGMVNEDCGGHSGKVSIDSIRSIKIKETRENE